MNTGSATNRPAARYGNPLWKHSIGCIAGHLCYSPWPSNSLTGRHVTETLLDEQIRKLDPFTFFVGYRSAIKSLGGPVQGPDPKYGFHTEYHEYRPGPVIFRVVFDRLAATFGELGIYVNAYVPGSGNNASMVTAARFSMTELSRNDSSFEIKFYAVKGVTYAIFGHFPEGTDARADALTITVRELGSIEASDVPADALEPTRFGIADIQRPGHLVENSRQPVFLEPVSQIMTPAQLDEPSFVELSDRICRPDEADGVKWRKAFVLQALDRYGFLEGGAAGLCLGDEDMAIASHLAAKHHAIVAGIDGERSPDCAKTPAADIFLAPRAMDFADIPDDLRGFDFLWSIGTANRMGSVKDASLFIENAMRCLRPGGIAIHMIDIVTTARPAGPSMDHMTLDRQEIARIAVTLISRSHEIAQLNFGNEQQGHGSPNRKHSAVSASDTVFSTTPFGLIARRNGRS